MQSSARNVYYPCVFALAHGLAAVDMIGPSQMYPKPTDTRTAVENNWRHKQVQGCGIIVATPSHLVEVCAY